MKKYYLFLLSCFFISSCDKSKSSYNIFMQKKAIIYSTPPEQELAIMRDIKGCYGLTLDKNTPSEARLILTKEKFDFKGPFHHDYRTSKNYDNISLPCENISLYTATLFKSYDNSIVIYMHFTNDTLSQIQLSFNDDNFNLEEYLISKYGQGNGEKKDTEFGIKKDGSLNFNDVTHGYEFRRWQNNKISIDWHEDNYLKDISKNKHYIYYSNSIKGVNNTVFYTSKKMAQRIIYYLNLSYSKLIQDEERNKETTLSNL